MTDLTFHLKKERGQSLGIGFRTLNKPPHCEVSVLVENGVAAQSGLQPGDMLLSVNGINVQHLDPNEVGGVLARHSVDPDIVLEVRRSVTNGNMASTTIDVDSSRDIGSLTPDIDSTMDIDSAPDTDIDDPPDVPSSPNPQIIVEPHSPPVSPDCVSPIVDGVQLAGNSETSPSPAWNGNSRSGQRPRRKNVISGYSGLPEIEEAATEGKDNLTAHNLNVQAPANAHRYSLTPEAVRKPMALDDLRRSNLRSSKSLDLANLPQWRAGKNSQQNVTLHNLLDGTEMSDRLHTTGLKEYKETGCTETHCKGSFMQLKPKRPYGTMRSPEETLPLAQDFIKQYYESKKMLMGADYENKLHVRLWQVEQEVKLKGYYDMTYEELTFGARTAWRNAPRCINRIVWRQLEVLDARHASTPKDMFQAICHHIKFANNGGNLRSTITVFPNRTKPKSDFRVWNIQLIRYAGYKMPDGSVLGDPASVEFTDMLIEDCGWSPPDPAKRTAFDVLPLVLQANGGDPELFEIPPELIIECEITHPEYDWFKDLGLKWYGLPAVSSMLLDCGGLEFPGVPFNGWYMGTEIARDLGDSNRYNMLKPIAQGLGLNTQTYKLWKDRAIVELNLAVLYSFQNANISIADHHSTSESFMTHMKSEVQSRGGCPADWVWIVPPISGSVTPVFHQEMLLYNLSPSYEYQHDPWTYHVWQGRKRERAGSLQGPNRFKRLANVVKIHYRMYRSFYQKRIKATILFATETGRSRNYANVVKDVFGRVFAAKVCCMEDYDKTNLENEQLLIIVTSTFGSGDPPSNGEVFGRYLLDLRNGTVALGSQTTPTPRSHRMSTIVAPSPAMLDSSKKNISTSLAQVKYAVFGLGSRAYPNFCTFAHTCDNLMSALGAETIIPCGEGDELCGQEESFQAWLQQCYHRACEVYHIEVEKTENDVLEGYKAGYNSDNFRIQTYARPHERKLSAELNKVHAKSIKSFVIKARTKLQSPLSDRSTILVVLDTNGNKVHYEPGDHLAVYPQNSAKLVSELIDCLNTPVDPDSPVYVESRRTSQTSEDRWVEEKRMPVPVTVRDALTYYLDIANPPSPQFLKLLAKQATRSTEQEELNELAKGGDKYEDWKYEKFPNMVDVLNQFHSLKIDVTLLLQQLPLLQCRYYSISSSPKMHPNEVHITVAIVSFRKRKGEGPRHNGVCSTWLNRIELGTQVPCVIRQAHAFHLPEDARTPIIMVGPGTGIAPYRSFWEERMYLQRESLKNQLSQPSGAPAQVPTKTLNLNKPSPSGRRRRRTEFEPPKLNLLEAPTASATPTGSSSKKSTCCFPMKRSLSDHENAEVVAKILAAKQKSWGDMTLYFGCRRSDLDHIYKDELNRAKVAGALTDVHVAYSRDPKQRKMYVQHLLKENADKVVKQLMEERGHFYVCGDISMAADVSRTLQSIFEENAAMSSEEARRLIESMKDRGFYHEDIFGVTLKHQEVTNRVRTAAKKAWRILVTSADSGHPLHSPMTPNARMISPNPMASRNFPPKAGGFDTSTMPLARSQRGQPKRPTVTVLVPATPPDGKSKPLDRKAELAATHGKASLQDGLCSDNSILKPSGGMKLITIEEPQKTILESVNEATESPVDKSPTEITLEEEPHNLTSSPRTTGVARKTTSGSSAQPSRKSHTVTGPPSQDALAPPQPSEKSKLERKKSDDGKVTRIRTKSRVETAL